MTTRVLVLLSLLIAANLAAAPQRDEPPPRGLQPPAQTKRRGAITRRAPSMSIHVRRLPVVVILVHQLLSFLALRL